MGTRLPQTVLPQAPPEQEPGAQTSKGQTRKRFVEGWNKGLSALREKIKKETGADEASKGAEGQAKGGSPTQPRPKSSDDGRLAVRAEESLWIRVGLAAFAVSAYVRSVLAPALASATPRAGLTAGLLTDDCCVNLFCVPYPPGDLHADSCRRRASAADAPLPPPCL